MVNQEDIINYYEQSIIAYKDVWHLDSCLALHYGFWEKGVKNLKQALIKENEVLSQLVDIKSSDVVLDAGCGVGGSSIFLSKRYNCSVHGITLSKEQVSLALQAAKNSEVSDLVNFSVRDFHDTSFKENSFDVIWFVESFCHSDNSKKLLKEMFRVLKPNGRIIIADGFLAKKDNNEKDNLVLNKWLNGWAVNTLPTLKATTDSMNEIGFHNIKTLNYSRKISRSALMLYVYANLALCYGKLRRLVGKKYGNQVTIKNTIGAKFQYVALKRNLWHYNIITCAKPN